MVATLRLDGRVCIITALLVCRAPANPSCINSGIGLETALVFAQEGAHVVCADINQQAAERAVELIKTQVSDSKEALAVVVDCGKEQQIKDMVSKAVEKFGRLDVIFNNAGIMHPADDHALNTEERIWDLTMTINLKGVWWGCKYAIEAMRKNPGGSKGSIINTASFVALMGAATPQIACLKSYHDATQGAVLAMTRELAMVHAREGIRLNNLCPGPLQTELLMSFLDTPEKKERRMVHIPMGRFGEAIEQAKAALFLASDDSSFITGTDFKVDGGIHACYVTPNGEQSLAPPKNVAPRA
ncbi:glucose 1-dehydrogenase [Microbotryum lychnidis-dioicae p1A1 Lamole]|uniref:Glucose 1-dehydrogenase n=1 Tax=Microbotryum lychnidis-dioicae (strain p1A1 Lamole / MvSl-1064) TaxID=683840 RepID=U5H0A5_USTV1|nr:glucose 1-dehydrogenase [Microbotryum lychnidis-dioicae p1A1 Lamole]|eukprot:KDE09127.1 glucose 1-dehydrogenase [Microbotryum lychnidis-dioicae p1A1 Lamole]